MFFIFHLFSKANAYRHSTAPHEKIVVVRGAKDKSEAKAHVEKSFPSLRTMNNGRSYKTEKALKEMTDHFKRYGDEVVMLDVEMRKDISNLLGM